MQSHDRNPGTWVPSSGLQRHREPWSDDHICNFSASFRQAKSTWMIANQSGKSLLLFPHLQAVCTSASQPSQYLPYPSTTLPYSLPGTPPSSCLKTQTSQVVTATWTAEIGIAKWCSHVTLHFTTAWFSNGNPNPKCHHNPRTISIYVFLFLSTLFFLKNAETGFFSLPPILKQILGYVCQNMCI